MKVLDIIIVLLLLLGAYSGFKRGFLLQVLSFLGLTIAVMSAFHLLKLGVDYLKPYLKDNHLVTLVAFVLIFAVVFAGIFLLAKFLKTVIDYTILGTFDKFTGAALGIVEAAFVLSVLIWLFNNLNMQVPNSYKEGTYIYPYLTDFAPKTVKYVSYVIPFQDIFGNLKTSFQQL